MIDRLDRFVTVRIDTLPNFPPNPKTQENFIYIIYISYTYIIRVRSVLHNAK